MKLGRDLRCRNCRNVPGGSESGRQAGGKAVRGARNREEKAPHLVAGLAHGIGAVLGQVAVDAKSNEIPAVRELLKAFTDLAGVVITAGALHTQRTRRHHRAPVARSRPCSVPAWTGFADAAQVAQVRRTVTRKGKKTVEVVYLITSDRDADPATLAAWVRDVTYQEDKSLVRTGNAPRVMASLRSLAVSLLRLDGHASIAAANRHHARDPQRTPGSAAVVEGHLVAVGVGEREGAAERPVDGR